MITVKGKHETCPRCGCDDTYWDETNADPDNDSAYFYMYCEGCEKHYNSVFVPSHQIYDEDD